MADKRNFEYQTQGFLSFLTGRMEMLDAFDRARDKAKSHKVEVFHGQVAESEFRKWLITFLPKKYGVTSGYIISQGLRSSDKIPHYDVIIYDQLESPILWVEDCPDDSRQGRSLAIPVEYVRCVIEVKSDFSSKTVGDATIHLKELLPLMKAVDEPDGRYKRHLPLNFYCGLVFFELAEKNQYNKIALMKVISGLELRGFFGGVILRGEGHTKQRTGLLLLTRSETPIQNNKESLLSRMVMSQTEQFEENVHFGSMLSWSESGFSMFIFDLLARLQGTYESGRVSSFHGLGRSGSELDLKF